MSAMNAIDVPNVFSSFYTVISAVSQTYSSTAYK